jgi:hypothetical protein
MNKLIIAFATALLTIPMLLSAPAEAGGKRGFHRSIHTLMMMQRHKRMRQQDSYSAAKRRAKQKAIYAAKKAAARKAAAKRLAAKKAAAQKAAQVAKIEEATKPEVKVAETENSAIATSSDKVADVAPSKTEAPKAVASVEGVGCKKYFASVGLTLSVPCG